MIRRYEGNEGEQVETTADTRVALVTGAASGLGRATALLLAEQGSAVACLDVADTTATADAIAAAGGRSLPVACDVSDETSIAAAVSAAVDAFGRLDVVVNAAGVAAVAHTLDVSVADWRRMLDVNLTGTFLVTREALPPLLETRGCVVNVASVAGLRGWRYMAAYSASKGGVVALTRSLAVEYGRRGVRVNCVCPGSIATPLAQGLSAPPDADPELLQRARALVDPPVAQPYEVASAVAYLASPAARFITGEVLAVDGGLLA